MLLIGNICVAKNPKGMRLTPRNIQEELLKSFVAFKRAQGRADSTINDYERFVRQFFNHYQNAFDDEKLLRKSFLSYLDERKNPSTFNLRLIYLSTFFKFCMQEGYLSNDPANGIKKRRASPRIVEIPEDSLQKLLSLPDRSTVAGLRDFSLLLLFLDTGIRPKEAFTLLVSDFDFKRNLVTIRAEEAKTRRMRVLPIKPVTANNIQQLIRNRHFEWSASVPVFCTIKGTMLNKDTWNDRLEFYCKKLGCKIRPYDLRHCFAIYYLRNSGDPFSLQRMMGHTNMDMTRRYLNITGDDLREFHDKSSPLNRLLPNKESAQGGMPKYRRKAIL